MPLMSSEIAGQIGMFQQQTAAFQQQSSFLSDALQKSVDPQMGAPWLAGRAMNMAGAVGVPAMGLGLGLAGLDPMSLGMRAAGAFGWARPGMAAAAGLGTFGLASAGMSGASWAAGQVWQGAQQQQAFGQQMRSSYNFLTPSGQGFNNQQLGVIGQQMRSFSQQVGPSGEMASMGELSALASNMGRMGMANGVRDVQDFSRKFKEMFETAKTMAREMSTTLEGAQQQMSQMRNSGVFRTSDQLRMSGEMRAYSLGGNLAMSELSGAASIGSQISRAVGGRGRAGAFGGMRTLGQIGLSLESGVLNEEDIYNATGMWGAEGRQAFAASQMQNSAAWLRNGKGRRFLASIAGADGKLDANSVSAWMSGDMGTGDTMQNAYSNLNKVGRADFIRNEGRLRGAALEQFGGNIPAMALMQWAGKRGIDVNTMNDREMLFAQRHTGLGMDELENAVKMLRDMPRIQDQSNRTQMTDAYRQEMATYRKTSGVEGVKRSMEHTREVVTGKLQAVGQQMYTDLTGFIEDWLTKQGGMIIQEASRDIDKTYQQVLHGDKKAMAALGAGGPGISAAAKSLGAVSSSNTGGGMTYDTFTKKMSFMGAGFGQSIQDKVAAGGFGSFFTGADSDAGVQRGVERAMAASRGMSNFGNKEASALGAKLSGMLNANYAAGTVNMKGDARMNAVRELLAKESVGNQDAAALFKMLNSGDTEQAYAALAAAEKGMGLADATKIGSVSQLPAGLGLMGSSGMTERERVESYGKAALGERGSRDYVAKGGAIGEMLFGGIGTVIQQKVGSHLGKYGNMALEASPMGLLGKVGKAIGMSQGYLANMAMGALGYAASPGEGAAIGTFLKSKEGMSLSQRMFSGEDISSDLQQRINGMSGDNESVKRQQAMLRSMMAANAAIRERGKTGKDLTEDQIRAIEKEHGAGAGTARGMIQDASRALVEQQAIDRRESLRMYGRGALAQQQRMQGVGFMDSSGGIDQASLDRIKASAGAGGADVLSKMAGLVSLQASGMSPGLTDKETAAKIQEIGAAGGDLESAMWNMSIADQRKLSSAARAEGAFGFADQLGQMAGFRSRTERTLQRKGDIGVANLFGLKVGKQDAQALMKGGKIASYLSEQFGLGDAAAGIQKEIDEITEKGPPTPADSEKLDALQSRLKTATAGDAELMAKFKGIQDEKDVSKRTKLISDALRDPELQKKQEERQKKNEMNDPQLKYLNDIASNMKTAVGHLATMASKSTPGKAPRPGGQLDE